MRQNYDIKNNNKKFACHRLKSKWMNLFGINGGILRRIGLRFGVRYCFLYN